VFTAGFSSGRWFERDADGGECNWGFVTEYDPPRRLMLSWHLTPEYKFDPDPDAASEIEVRFTPQDGGTLVELEHRGFERRTAGGAQTREAVSGEGGWTELLQLYARAF
jgi:uncharacterized protein YndB with AHSA1/START domain